MTVAPLSSKSWMCSNSASLGWLRVYPVSRRHQSQAGVEPGSKRLMMFKSDPASTTWHGVAHVVRLHGSQPGRSQSCSVCIGYQAFLRPICGASRISDLLCPGETGTADDFDHAILESAKLLIAYIFTHILILTCHACPILRRLLIPSC